MASAKGKITDTTEIKLREKVRVLKNKKTQITGNASKAYALAKTVMRTNLVNARGHARSTKHARMHLRILDSFTQIWTGFNPEGTEDDPIKAAWLARDAVIKEGRTQIRHIPNLSTKQLDTFDGIDKASDELKENFLNNNGDPDQYEADLEKLNNNKEIIQGTAPFTPDPKQESQRQIDDKKIENFKRIMESAGDK